MANIWVVRAGRGGTYADEFEQIGIAAIGFGIEESVSGLKSRDAILSALTRQYPNMRQGRAVNWASQLHRFVHEIKQGDTILTPIQDTREIMIGTCAGPYRYEPDQDRGLSSHPPGLLDDAHLKGQAFRPGQEQRRKHVDALLNEPAQR